MYFNTQVKVNSCYSSYALLHVSCIMFRYHVIVSVLNLFNNINIIITLENKTILRYSSDKLFSDIPGGISPGHHDNSCYDNTEY